MTDLESLSRKIERQDQLIGENIALMRSGSEGGMQFYLLRTTADDGRKTGVIFLYDPKTGKINFFGGVEGISVPSSIRDTSCEGRFIALRERSPKSRYRLSISAFGDRTTDIARETLDETVARYNANHGF